MLVTNTLTTDIKQIILQSRETAIRGGFPAGADVLAYRQADF